MKYTTLSDFKPEKRRAIRKLLLEQLDGRKKQMKLFNELFIEPIKHNIDLLSNILINKECIERYMLSSKNLNKTLKVINFIDKNEKK